MEQVEHFLNVVWAFINNGFNHVNAVEGLVIALIAAIIAGGLIGYFEPAWGQALQPLSIAFVKLVKMVIGAVIFRMLQEIFSTITPQYWQFWIGAVLVVIVLVGRGRLHRWALWLPNLVITQLAGRKAGVAVPEGDAP